MDYSLNQLCGMYRDGHCNEQHLIQKVLLRAKEFDAVVDAVDMYRRPDLDSADDTNKIVFVSSDNWIRMELDVDCEWSHLSFSEKADDWITDRPIFKIYTQKV